MKAWTLTEAQVRLRDVVRDAQQHGPQFVVREGREVAVVLSAEEYRELEAPGFLLGEFGGVPAERGTKRPEKRRRARGGSRAPSPDPGEITG
jgi:prevent-host-death family protein